MIEKRVRVRVGAGVGAFVLSLTSSAGLWNGAANAQAQSEASVALPEVVVTAPKGKTQATKKKKAKSPQAIRVQAAKAAPAATTPPTTQSEQTGSAETATGRVKGIVATRSATGTKTDTPLIETSQSISVITADRMEQQAVTSVTDALAYTAGVRAGTFGVDSRYDWINIRGFSAYTPGFFVDGMMERNTGGWGIWKVEPYGAERIEVLKGPPSVLYGQANPGGLINVVSKRPLDEPLYETGLEIGNHGRVQGTFDFSAPVTQDGKLSYRLTGVVLDTDSQVDFADQKRGFIAPAVTWRPNANTTLTVLGQYLREDAIPSLQFLPDKGTLLPNPNGKIRRSLYTGEPDYDRFEHEQWSAGYMLEHRFDDVWKVRQNLRYSEVSLDYKTLYGAGLADDPSEQLLNRGSMKTLEHTASFTTDNQVQADFMTGAIGNTVLAGLDYQRHKFDMRTGFGSGDPLNMYHPVYGTLVVDPPLEVYDNDTTLSQVGLYLQEQAKIDRWVLTLGGRYDWAETYVDDRLTDSTLDKKDGAFTWRGGILYHADNGLAPYFSYSESFLPSIELNPTTNNLFGPETGKQYEVGIKYQPLNQKALYTLAAFDITRQNYITYDSIGTPHASGEVRSRGLEFEATTELARGLDLIAAYTWIPDFRMVSSSLSEEIGKRDPTVAEHMASLWLHYRFQSGALKGFGFGGGVRYIGETFGNWANTISVPSYTLFDGVVDYEVDDWRFAVNVTNIGDTETLSCSDTCYFGPDRTIIASIRRRW